MCGIIGLLLADGEVNQMLFDGLTVLQHRGQDAAGMVTASSNTTQNSNSNSCNNTNNNHKNTSSSALKKKWRLHLRKDNGLVKDVFQQHHMMELRGHVGLGHCRYPTAGSSSCSAEAQPLYTNYPYGICVAHNGNITNTEQLATLVQDRANRHVNTDSDSELLLNLFAEQLTQQQSRLLQNGDGPVSSTSSSGTNNNSNTMQNAIFAAMTQVMEQCHGGYAGLFLINGYGLVGFRDPHGIRPLVFGCRKARNTAAPTTTAEILDDEGIPMTPKNMENVSQQLDYCICSESVALDTLGFKLIRYVVSWPFFRAWQL
jgi:amidophosphoribosyltransferase